MHIFLFSSLFVLSFWNHQPQPQAQDLLHWHLDMEEAQAAAQQKNVPILIVFSGSDWCRPCMKLETELFDTEDFQTFAQTHLVLVKADFPRSRKKRLRPKQQAHNSQLAEQFNPSGLFPFLVLLSPEGEVLDEIGYLDPESGSYIERWQAFLTP